MNFTNLLILISSFQGFVLGLVIIFSPIFKSKANNYLGYTISTLSLILFNFYLDNTETFEIHPIIELLITIEWGFLFPVFLLFYIIHIIKHNLIYNKRLKWLYLPIILSIIIHLVITLEYDFHLFQYEFKGKTLLYNLIAFIEEISTYFFITILIIWSRFILHKTSKNQSLNVVWLKKLWLFLFLILLSYIALVIIDAIVYDNYPEFHRYVLIYQYVIDIELSLLVYWIAYTGLYKLRIANERKEILDILHKKSSKIEKQNNPDLQESKQSTKLNDHLKNNVHFVQLEELLHKHHIYRDPNLSREAVAQRLGISTGYLSQIINKTTQKNFTAYINSFRVADTKRMILDKEFDKYSLLSIGLESGFNSKTTFYTAFKKEAGCTPSEFKKQHK